MAYEVAPIHSAIVQADLGWMGRLLEEDSRNASLPFGPEQTPPLYLVATITRGTVVMAELLLDHGAEVDAMTRLGGTALRAAVLKGKRELVNLLLARGADPNFRHTDLLNPLLTAVHLGYTEIVRDLVHNGRCAIDFSQKGYGNILSVACTKGYVEIARILLLEAGYNFYEQQRGAIAVLSAQAAGHQACVDLLRWYAAETERFNLLIWAWRWNDLRRVIQGVAVRTKCRTRDQERRVRVAAAPLCLQERVVKGEALPRVEVATTTETHGTGRRRTRASTVMHQQDVVRAVLHHVIDDMKEDVLLELLRLMDLPTC